MCYVENFRRQMKSEASSTRSLDEKTQRTKLTGGYLQPPKLSSPRQLLNSAPKLSGDTGAQLHRGCIIGGEEATRHPNSLVWGTVGALELRVYSREETEARTTHQISSMASSELSSSNGWQRLLQQQVHEAMNQIPLVGITMAGDAVFSHLSCNNQFLLLGLQIPPWPSI